MSEKNNTRKSSGAAKHAENKKKAGKNNSSSRRNKAGNRSSVSSGKKKTYALNNKNKPAGKAGSKKMQEPSALETPVLTVGEDSSGNKKEEQAPVVEEKKEKEATVPAGTASESNPAGSISAEDAGKEAAVISEKTKKKDSEGDQKELPEEKKQAEENPDVEKSEESSALAEGNSDQAPALAEEPAEKKETAEADADGKCIEEKKTDKKAAFSAEETAVPEKKPVPSTQEVLKKAEESSRKSRRKQKVEDTIGLPVLDQIITPQDFVPQFEDEISGEKTQIPGFLRYVQPLECMMKQAVSGIHDTAGRALWGIFMKYALIGLGVTFSAGHFLNQEPFGMARMTFSDGSWLWARIAVCGLLTELICILLKALTGGRKFVKNGYGRLRDIQGEAAPFIGILGFASGLLLIVSPVWSFAGWMITFSCAVALRAYAFELCFKADRKRTLIALAVEAFAAAVLITLLFRLLGADVMRVMESFYAF